MLASPRHDLTAPGGVKRMLGWIRGGLVAPLVVPLLALGQLCGAHRNWWVIHSASRNLARNLVSSLSTCLRHTKCAPI